MSNMVFLKDKRREKQMKYERSMLKEVSVKELKKGIHIHFATFFHYGLLSKWSIEEGCADFAIESFLLGAKYSKFGFRGESMTCVQNRSGKEETRLTADFYDYIISWGCPNESVICHESLYIASECFMQHWWKEGFLRGQKRYKLRLH
ncbi:DUF2521 family protein [Metabacillus sp. 84]|uniref:DUF2521 family protein n=1 Tax=Metabacillus sp. 84 TaxID=3404705 RepID=UPI003CE8AC0A